MIMIIDPYRQKFPFIYLQYHYIFNIIIHIDFYRQEDFLQYADPT